MVVGVPGECNLADSSILSWKQGLVGIREPDDELPSSRHSLPYLHVVYLGNTGTVVLVAKLGEGRSGA